MARKSLETTCREIYSFLKSRACVTRDENSTIHNPEKIYMNVPLHGGPLEIPVLAFNEFINAIKEDIDYIAVSLKTKGFISSYKTLERYMQEVLVTPFNDYQTLIRLNNNKEPDKPYYGSYGIILDHNFYPLVTCCYQINHYEYNTETDYLKIIATPLLKIDPSCYINQNTSIEKYIKKIINAFLNCGLNPIIGCNNWEIKLSSPKVVIEKCQFSFRRIQRPTLETTHKDLMGIVLKNMDEFICQ